MGTSNPFPHINGLHLFMFLPCACAMNFSEKHCRAKYCITIIFWFIQYSIPPFCVTMCLQDNSTGESECFSWYSHSTANLTAFCQVSIQSNPVPGIFVTGVSAVDFGVFNYVPVPAYEKKPTKTCDAFI